MKLKTLLFTLMLIAFCNAGIAQKHIVIGAWYWSNATKEASIFLKKDGTIEMHSGKKGDVILPKNLKVGKYACNEDVFTITWSDNTKDTYNLNFVDKDSFPSPQGLLFINKKESSPQMSSAYGGDSAA